MAKELVKRVRFERFVGINKVEIIAVSPNQLEQVALGWEGKETDYIKSEGKEITANIKVIGKYKGGIVNVSIWLKNTPKVITSNKSGVNITYKQWVNELGQTSNGDTKEQAIESMRAFNEKYSVKKTDYTTLRELYDGEDNLIKLVKCVAEDYFDKTTVDGFLKGNFKPLVDLFKGEKIEWLIGINDKDYLTVYTGAFGSRKAIEKSLSKFAFKSKYPINLASISESDMYANIKPDNVEDHIESEKTDELPF